MTSPLRAPLSSVAVLLSLVASPAPAAVPERSQPHRSQSGEVSPTPDPRSRVGRANAAARVEPERSSYFNAIQQYAYEEGALFQVYTAPGQVTDIALQPGEQLVGPGPVASGDTVRWIIGDTVSGSGQMRRVHILVKPTRTDIATNLVINTDRRTYHIELRSTSSTYMAAVSWTYPQDELIALYAAETAQAARPPAAPAIDIAQLDFAYRLSGDRPDWRPLRVFDDGRQTFVEFAEDIAVGEMPPLFVLGADDRAELVNYRVQGRFMIVDRLFERAELRLRNGRQQKEVRIERVRERRNSAT